MHKAMYPLDPLPERLSSLLKLFCQTKDMERCVRHQLIGGAKIAQAFVRVRHPTLNFHEMHKFPSSVGDRVDFVPHYAVVGGPAEKMIDKTRAETERLLREGVSRQ